MGNMQGAWSSALPMPSDCFAHQTRRKPGGTRAPDFVAKNPSATVPFIEDEVRAADAYALSSGSVARWPRCPSLLGSFVVYVHARGLYVHGWSLLRR